MTAAALLLGGLALAGDARVPRALASLRSNLAPLRTLTADVSVDTVAKKVWTEATYRQRYRYAFRKPSSVRLDFISPAGQVIIARGRAVWVNGRKTQGGPGADTDASPLSLLRLSLAPDEVAREYAITAFAEPAHPALTGLTLTPLAGKGPITAVKVWVDAARGVVQETKVFGAQEALLSTSVVGRFERASGVWIPAEMVTYGCEGRCKTTITYANIRVNAALPAGAFDPAPPKP